VFILSYNRIEKVLSFFILSRVLLVSKHHAVAAACPAEIFTWTIDSQSIEQSRQDIEQLEIRK